MLGTRSKGEADLTKFTDNPEKISGKRSNKKKTTITDQENIVVPPRDDTETEENNQPPQEDNNDNMGDTPIVKPTEEMYLPDLNNTPLSQALKDGIEWGIEEEVMVECPKLKQYFGVDTLLVQAISGRVHLYTNNKIEAFPVHCSKTKFLLSLLEKALKGAMKQRATPKDLPGEDWQKKLNTVLSRADLEKRRCICRTMWYVRKEFSYS